MIEMDGWMLEGWMDAEILDGWMDGWMGCLNGRWMNDE